MISIRTCALISSLLLAPLAGWAATPSPSTTTLTLSPSTVAKNAAVTFTAAVNSGGKTVSPGKVLFCNAAAARCEDAAIFGTAQLTSAGTASIKLTLGVGTHSIKAVFAGTNAIAGSSSNAESLTVTGKNSTTSTISVSGSSGNYTLSAAVAGAGNPSAGPSGNVYFLDAMNNRVLGNAALGASTPALGFGNEGASTAAGSTPAANVTGDFNNDGKLDLAVLNQVNTAGSMSVLLGNGNGTFQQAVTYATGIDASSIAAGDFNSDGKLDLAVLNPTSASSQGSVGVFLGNGDGTFQNQVTYPVSGHTYVTVGDFNGDGIPDLVTDVIDTSSSTQGVSILLGNGDGTFQSQQTIYTTSDGVLGTIAVSDFNSDGKLDIAFLTEPPVSPPGYTLRVMLGNGDGTFQSPVNTAVGSPTRLLAGDFNGDGKTDLAVYESGSVALGVLLGNGNGAFQNEVSYSSTYGVSGLYLGDFNGDGILDMLTTVLPSDVRTPPSQVDVFLGKGDGTFQGTIVPTNGVFDSSVYSVGDFNGDSYPDLALLNFAIQPNGNVGVSLNASGQTATATATHINAGSSQYFYSFYPGDSNYIGSLSCQIGLNTTPSAPVISGVTVSNITSTSVTISWTSNVATYGGVNYGLTTAFGSKTPWVVPVSTAHSFTLTGLTPGSTYDYQAWSVSYFSGCNHWTTFSSTATFTTANQ